jgi:hypothetical protein
MSIKEETLYLSCGCHGEGLIVEDESEIVSLKYRKKLAVYDAEYNYLSNSLVFPKGTSDETIHTCVKYMQIAYENGKLDIKKRNKKFIRYRKERNTSSLFIIEGIYE